MLSSSSSSSSHSQNLPSVSNIHQHHQPRQSKLLDNQTYSQPHEQSPQLNKFNKQSTIKDNPIGGFTSNRINHRRSNNNTPPTCANCGTQTTPLWRRNQLGETLCNACALFQKMKGRPRPISLKTNVIKPRNRLKAIDRIPLCTSQSVNQQQAILIATPRNNRMDSKPEDSRVIVPLNRENEISPNPSEILPHLSPFHSNPGLSSTASSPLSPPTSNLHLLGTHHTSPKLNHPTFIPSQSPTPSHNSYCSTRSAPQLQSRPTQLVRSGVSSRKSSPGPPDSFNDSEDTTIPFRHGPKRRKYILDDLLSKLNIYERRTSTSSLEPLHHPRRSPLEVSGIVHIPNSNLKPHLEGTLGLPPLRKTTPSDHSSHQFLHDAPPSHSTRHHHASVEDKMPSRRPSQLVSETSSFWRTSGSVDRASVGEDKEPGHIANPTCEGSSRRRTSTRASRITLPPLSQITKDLVPAFQLNPSPITYGPPSSFEASAREARMNSPSWSQSLLTIPSLPTHPKKLENRRAGSVISSVSDSESLLSPANSASTGSRVHSPLDRSCFPGHDGPPCTTSVIKEGSRPHRHRHRLSVSSVSHDNDISGDNQPCQDTKKHPQIVGSSEAHQTKKSKQIEPQTEVNRLKNRICHLELINGAMENRINQLENSHPGVDHPHNQDHSSHLSLLDPSCSTIKNEKDLDQFVANPPHHLHD